MFNRLSKIDLSRWLDGATPTLTTRVVVTVVLLLIVSAARRAVEAAFPGVLPFALQFPAVLLATLLAGWMSGAAVVVIGGVAAWFIAMRHPGGTGPTEADAVTLLLYFASAGSIVAFAELFRARARMLVRGQAALQASEARLELATKAAAV
ncbi:hypothetical protein, partial [Phenylobacterium sp.]|uniref:hypothetical protein n=1 Tax=Phenylobacterium sp. TaxID=1871053 RepID=UPI002E336324